MADHPGRRSTDRGWRVLVRENAYRDVWLLIITAVVLVTLWRAEGAINSTRDFAHVTRALVVSQQEGRRTAIAVSCAVESAVAEAGRAVLSRVSPETPFTRGLERLGYPPLRVRRAQASVLGQAYVQSISQRVEQAVGRRGDRLVLPNGTLDCKRFEALARAS